MPLEKKSEGDKGHPVVRLNSGCRVFCGLLWKLALAALLVYGILQVGVRTDWFRSHVERELSRLAGMEMRVGRIRATESLNLKLSDVISVSEVAGIEARVVRIRWRWIRPQGATMLESVRVDGLALTIAPDADGVLQPLFLEKAARTLSDWVGVGHVAGSAPVREAEAAGADRGREQPPQAFGSSGAQVQLKGVSVRLQDAAGNLQASVSGMDLAWVSMELPQGGWISHVNAHAGEIQVVNGPRITGLHLELIDTGAQQFLVALDAADWGAAQKPQVPGAGSLELLRAME